MSGDPFASLGLAADPALTDDDIRAAWRRIAAATHPDRADGGEPASFAAAAAAYSRLRTPFGRGEALADLSTAAPGGTRALGWTARLANGRPVRLALRVLAAVIFVVVAVAAAGWSPATVALLAGALTWVIRYGRCDLAARAPAARPQPAAARRRLTRRRPAAPERQ